MIEKKNRIKEPPKGELYIEDYLGLSNIEYKSQYKINDLKGDTANHRVADFYLPNLGFYVEYHGMYNETKVDRERYKWKNKIYISNKKPTVFLYPHDLGILDYAFHTEVKRLFGYKIYHDRRKYLRYSLNRYLNIGKPTYLLLAINQYLIAIVLFYYENLGLDKNAQLFFAIVSSLIAAVYFYKFIMNLLFFISFKAILGFVNLKELK